MMATARAVKQMAKIPEVVGTGNPSVAVMAIATDLQAAADGTLCRTRYGQQIYVVSG